jgi:AAA domain
MGAAMVCIDPLNAYLSTALDSFKDHGIRKALAPLARMAAELEVACVVICHLNKDRGGQPL